MRTREKEEKTGERRKEATRRGRPNPCKLEDTLENKMY